MSEPHNHRPLPLPFFHTFSAAFSTIIEARDSLNTFVNNNKTQLALLNHFFNLLHSVQHSLWHSHAKPLVIAVEGLDGTGKTTVSKRLSAPCCHLQPFPALHIQSVCTPPKNLTQVRAIFDAFPDERVTRAFYTSTNYILQHGMRQQQQFSTHANINVFIVDRFYASTAAYTAAPYRTNEQFTRLEHMTKTFRVPPDLDVPAGTIILDVNDETRSSRIHARNVVMSKNNVNPWDKRLSVDFDLARRIRTGLKLAAGPQHMTFCVDATNDIERVVHDATLAVAHIVVRSVLVGGVQMPAALHNLVEWAYFAVVRLGGKKQVKMWVVEKGGDVMNNGLEAQVCGVENKNGCEMWQFVTNTRTNLNDGVEVTGRIECPEIEITVHGTVSCLSKSDAIEPTVTWMLKPVRTEFSMPRDKDQQTMDKCEWHTIDGTWVATKTQLNVRHIGDPKEEEETGGTTVALTGTHCCGKTTIGSAVAQALDFSFDVELGDVLCDRQSLILNGHLHGNGSESGSRGSSGTSCGQQSRSWDCYVFDKETQRDGTSEHNEGRVVETWHVGNHAWAYWVRRKVNTGRMGLDEAWERVVQAVRDECKRKKVVFVHLETSAETCVRRRRYGKGNKMRLPMEGGEEEQRECERLHKHLCVDVRDWLKRLVNMENKVDVPLLIVRNDSGEEAIHAVVNDIVSFVKNNA